MTEPIFRFQFQFGDTELSKIVNNITTISIGKANSNYFSKDKNADSGWGYLLFRTNLSPKAASS